MIAQQLPLLRRLAFAFARRLPGTDPRDLVSVGAIGLLEATDAYEPTLGPYAHFATRVAADTMRDALRAQKSLKRGGAVQHVSLDQTIGECALTYHEVLPAPGPSPEDEAILSERRKLFAAALLRLPSRSRRVIRAMAEGFTEREIAANLGVSCSRVGRLARESLRVLRAFVEGKICLPRLARSVRVGGCKNSSSRRKKRVVAGRFTHSRWLG